jgi:HK97 family phage portal protein
MSLIGRLLAAETRSVEDPRYPITQERLASLLSGPPSATGKPVNPQTAMGLTAVFACVRVIAEPVATLPLLVYRRLGRGKERATDHPLYPLLHHLPNPEMSSVEMREALMGHVLLRGNAYAEIVPNGRGEVMELWPLRPDRTTPMRNASGNLVYEVYLDNGEPRYLPKERVLHIRGLGFDGLVGYSPITLAREALGLSMAAEEYGARFFSNSSRPSGVLSTDKRLNETAAKRLKSSWEEAHSGLSNAHRVAILEEGITWKQIGIAPQDAQFLETRQYQTIEICRIFRVFPHMIGEMEKSTSWGTGIEQQQIGFVVHVLRPWLVRWEQAIYRSLFRPQERDAYFAEFLVDGLLRGDAEARARALATMRQNGIISANDWREIENMNPYEGGDEYLVNAALVPVDQAGTTQEGNNEEEPERSNGHVKGTPIPTI